MNKWLFEISIDDFLNFSFCIFFFSYSFVFHVKVSGKIVLYVPIRHFPTAIHFKVKYSRESLLMVSDKMSFSRCRMSINVAAKNLWIRSIFIFLFSITDFEQNSLLYFKSLQFLITKEKYNKFCVLLRNFNHNNTPSHVFYINQLEHIRVDKTLFIRKTLVLSKIICYSN